MSGSTNRVTCNGLHESNSDCLPVVNDRVIPTLLLGNLTSTSPQRLSASDDSWWKGCRFLYGSQDFILHSAWGKDKNSKFDETLQKSWDHAREAGHFRYDLGDMVTRVLSGDYGFVAQLNTKRATHRRKPQEMQSVAQPFNPKNFNFTKVKSGEILMELCTGGEDDGGSRHVIIINVSPLEYCSILLVPDINEHLPQALTLDALRVGIEIVLLSSKRSFRVGWNGLCALASVNHLHFHAYYLDYQLRIETEPTNHLAGPCHLISSWPVPGFVFQLVNGDVTSLARNVYTVTRYFHDNEIAHNIFMMRGSQLGSGETTPDGTTLRVFIWPRTPVYGVKDVDAFNVAFCEIGGHIPVKNAESFPLLTDKSAVAVIEKVRLPEDRFDAIREDIKKLFL